METVDLVTDDQSKSESLLGQQESIENEGWKQERDAPVDGKLKSKKSWDVNVEVNVLSYDKKPDDFYYEIEVTSKSTRETTFVFRGYKEIQWLYRFCDQKTDIGGHVLHPLPMQPYEISPTLMELDLDSHALNGRINGKAIRAVESFLCFIVQSEFFSGFSEVQDFFSNETVPAHEPLTDGGLLSSLTRVYTNYQYSQLPDPEESFTKALQCVDEKLPLLLAAGEACERDLEKQKNMAISITGVLLSLDELSSHEVDCMHKDSNQYLARQREGLDFCQQCRFDIAIDQQNTLSLALDLYYHYYRQFKSMLLRRRKSLQQLQTCRTQLEKAKPQKKEAADAAHEAADKEYEEVTAIAKKEVMSYQSRYMLGIRRALVDCCEAHISHYNKTANCLAGLVAEMKN